MLTCKTLSRARNGLIAAFFVVAGGCVSIPEPVGFISDYSRLEKTGRGKLSFISPDLKNYDSFVVDPVRMLTHQDPPVLKPKERAEVTKYFDDALEKMLRMKGVKLVSAAGAQTARVRCALTDVQRSTWYLNLHPGMKLSGVGLGGAAMEGEVIDSVTGAQLAAVIQAAKGNQFELDTFNSLDDIKDVIDKWAKEAGKAFDEPHGRLKD